MTSTIIPAILLASSNPGKIAELRELLQGITVVCPEDLGLALRVEESGQTFAANARLKAEAYAAAADMPAVADDSGLVVDALAGRPRIYSARVAAVNNQHISRL